MGEGLADVVGAADDVVGAVDFAVEGVVVGPEFVDGLHHVEVDEGQGGGGVVGEEVLDAVEEFALVAAEERLVVDGPPGDAGDGVAFEFRLEFFRIDPFGREDLERQGVTHADVQIEGGEVAHDTGAGIADGIDFLRNLRGRKDPGQAGLGIGHAAVPAFHRDDGQVALEGGFVALLAAVEPFFVEQLRQLAHGQAIHVRDGEFADVGEEARFHHAALNLFAAQRVGAVEDHHGHAVFGAGAHHQAQGADEGVGTGAYILDVIDHHVEAFEHFGRRLAVFAVDGIYFQAGRFVEGVFGVAAGIDVAADAVFRGEEADQVDVFGFIEDVDGRLEIAVDAAGVGEQAHFLAFESRETAVTQHFDARFDHRCGAAGLRLRAAAGAERQYRHGP